MELGRARSGPALLPMALALFVALGLVGILRHEMWRDEAEIWLIARGSDSVGQLFHNMRTEGHPALWYLLVFAVSRWFHDPVSMQLLHLAIGAGSAALILGYAPFSARIRILLCFSYFVFYEYTIISRNYGVEFLLAFAFCALHRARARPTWLALVLFLLANTHLYGAILAASLALFAILDAGRRGGVGRSRPEVVLALVLAAAGVALGLGQVAWQGIRIGSAHYVRPDLGLESLLRALSTIQDGYLPLPDFRTRSFWNTSVLDALSLAPSLAVSVPLSIALVGVSAWLLAPRRSVLALFGAGTFSMFAVTLLVYFGELRHHGQIFLLFVIGCWLRHEPGEDRRQVLRERFLAGLLVVQVFVGFYAFALDLRYPFSNAAALGHLLKQPPYADRVLVGSHDFAVQSVAAYAGRPIFYPESGAFGTFVDWGANRRNTLPIDALRSAVALAEQRGEPVLMILNVRPADFTDAWRAHFLASGVAIRYAAGFDDAIVPDENYVMVWVLPPGARGEGGP